MANIPSQRELDETIARTTARFAKSRDAKTADLMEAYTQLSARFAKDLTDRRDIALSRAALLTMVRYLLEDGGPTSTKRPA